MCSIHSRLWSERIPHLCSCSYLVCGMIPSSAATTSTTMSVTAAPLARMELEEVETDR